MARECEKQQIIPQRRHRVRPPNGVGKPKTETEEELQEKEKNLSNVQTRGANSVLLNPLSIYQAIITILIETF